MFKKIIELFQYLQSDKRKKEREFVRKNKVDILRYAEKNEQHL